MRSYVQVSRLLFGVAAAFATDCGMTFEPGR
jgi:hypothetical protein